MRQSWFLKLLPLIIVGTFAVSCQSKKAKPDGDGQLPPAASDESLDASPEIAQKDINFDSMGSDSGKIPGLSTVRFGYDKSTLTEEAKQQLAENAEWIKRNSRVTVQIEGHTDARGSIEYNISLGERRAKAVKSYLVNLGVNGSRLRILSYGEEKPVASGDSEEAWGQNRRANFVPLPE